MTILEAALMCLALNIYHEARGENLAGQRAIAQVTMNRADHKKENICDEVFKPKQFSWTNSLIMVSKEKRLKNYPRFMPDFNSKAWIRAKQIAHNTLVLKNSKAVIGKDVEYFYNPSIANPKWKNSFTVVAQIDNHVFLRE